ncbi:hypothetical protein BD626DRAFT_520607 [Schizophyllum amplum]|uniref:Uncharacterized protein n=1 Tax=Schizophyllum amplum TaxID=97359 RepID=A0A550BUH9_9AGAR|nr:hypothetical protein BD626DRAFT_520607 [Auriculariopsis ampla]
MSLDVRDGGRCRQDALTRSLLPNSPTARSVVDRLAVSRSPRLASCSHFTLRSRPRCTSSASPIILPNSVLTGRCPVPAPPSPPSDFKGEGGGVGVWIQHKGLTNRRRTRTEERGGANSMCDARRELNVRHATARHRRGRLPPSLLANRQRS